MSRMCPLRPWRFTHVTAITLVSALLLTVPAIGRAQALAPTAPATSSQEYLDLIQAKESESGIYDPGLVEPLTTLGILYREQGRYDLSASSLLRARQLLRINQGLSTLDEVRILDELVRTEEAQGDLTEMLEYEQALLTVAKSHLGALQTWPVFMDLAGKRMDLLSLYLAGERPPQIYAGCYYAKTIDYAAINAGIAPALAVPQSDAACNSGDRPTVQRALLIEAITYQGWALEALLENNRYASDDLLEFMAGFFRSSDLLHRLMSQGSEYFIAPVWRKMLRYEAQDLNDRARLAQVQLLLADLNLLRLGRDRYFDDYDQLYDQYHQAYQALAAEGADEALLAEIFEPPVPVLLPVHLTNPFSEATGDARGEYIDASFNIDERGKAWGIRIVTTSDGVTRDERKKLERLIRESRFRPRLVEGTTAEATSVVVRYHVGATDSPPVRPSISVGGITLH